MIKRHLGRSFDEIRNVIIEVNVNKFAEGSCYIKMGDTEVLCTATVEERIPAWLKYNYPRSGWITAEYGMLPRATGRRNEREAVLGKQAGRTQEVQRLIGRSLRSAVNLQKLGERQIKIDCDVIQADGGTRCASITGAWIALYFACQKLFNMGKLEQVPIISNVVAISCGIYNGHIILDLDYHEDSEASADANFVITDKGQLVEVQVSGEQATFSPLELMNMLDLAQSSVPKLIKLQNEAIGLKK